MRYSKSIKIMAMVLSYVVIGAAGFFAGWAGASARTVVWLESPDGDLAAWVEEGVALDPPAQSLWVGTPDGTTATKLAQLAEDQEWSNQIFWDAGGRRVGFVVAGQRAEIFDARKARIIDTVTLVPASADKEARNVEFVAGGDQLQFLECRRGSAQCFGERRVSLEVAG